MACQMRWRCCFQPDDDGQPIVQLVPASEHLKDYPQRVEEIVSALSVIEQRPVEEILRNIVTPTCDLLHLRVDSIDTQAGRGSASFAIRCGLRNIPSTKRPNWQQRHSSWGQRSLA